MWKEFGSPEGGGVGIVAGAEFTVSSGTQLNSGVRIPKRLSKWRCLKPVLDFFLSVLRYSINLFISDVKLAIFFFFL